MQSVTNHKTVNNRYGEVTGGTYISATLFLFKYI